MAEYYPSRDLRLTDEEWNSILDRYSKTDNEEGDEDWGEDAQVE